MPEKRKRFIFLLGAPGGGKTTYAEELLNSLQQPTININKDILEAEYKEQTKSKSLFSKFLKSNFKASPNQEWKYRVMIYMALYSLRNKELPGSAIIEGNFGKRLTRDFLETCFAANSSEYDLYIIRVYCSDPELQYQRVRHRNDPKDTDVRSDNRVYDLTKRDDFLAYRAQREQEELDCIRRMSSCMKVITIDNNKTLTKQEQRRVACDLKNIIEYGTPPTYSMTLPITIIDQTSTPNDDEDNDEEISVEVQGYDDEPQNNPAITPTPNISPLKLPRPASDSIPHLNLDPASKSSSPRGLYYSSATRTVLINERPNPVQDQDQGGRKSPRLRNMTNRASHV